ncbi:MAG TPA: P-II family nitrogen regulator [Syntrophomonadaceae bacterium]|nr:P-II family nitrogen regulator [Syntrophomonadaceae bacterium]
MRDLKKVEAIIRPNKFDEVKTALDQIGVRGITVYEVSGRGLQKSQKKYYRGQEHTVDLFPKIKLETVCEDESVENIISVILRECHTGKAGDGKIFVYPVERVIRISSREEGGSAL